MWPNDRLSVGRRQKRQSLTFESLEQRRLLASDIEHLYGLVHDIASTYIHCPATCDDVVQETVIKIVGHWDTVESLEVPAQNAYVVRATHNTFLDWVRADIRKSELVERAFTDAASETTGAENPVEAVLTAEVQANIERWMRNQYGVDRRILLLRQQGMTFEQIGEQLELAKSTVQYRCQRLMEACFRQLVER
ncbi:MAG: sigma-70 family RNA polymerase sigma factor [Pirellulaceae bacterium]|nr:sigma-70 family RNA polymerase sigma factor [Pirellulaceae bacterium]